MAKQFQCNVRNANSQKYKHKCKSVNNKVFLLYLNIKNSNK